MPHQTDLCLPGENVHLSRGAVKLVELAQALNCESCNVLRTLPILCGSGWYKASALKRDLGMGLQLSLPATHRSQNLEAFAASPPNLQLKPTRATGQELCVLFLEEASLKVPLVSEVLFLGPLRDPLILGSPFIASAGVESVLLTVPGEVCAPFEKISGAILDRKLVTNRVRRRQ